MTKMDKIKVRLKALAELQDVTVDISTSGAKIHITHNKQHTADFVFSWVGKSHYAGYFIDAKGRKSQAIVALWNPMDAVKFMVLYCTLVEMRAKRDPKRRTSNSNLP